ncbi:trypsin-like peptidase domain-containing protein [Nonomuraea sp. K274]|uniref:Trypsin-like peptidase domain-containing protein n=1 Tax=Nonomuraea cypriaca TaxID=1187855 RepID=A0A931ABK4_9ACTN|nr:trypsin-like peptidase domain-containing protein [Nonomuraea cypriaca]MBF8188565.1 trypsin-like peptidase domain-containing protein [Nonomuraea cypriaca]
MTDETRPTEGRTPSDSPEPQGRPDFLPADDWPEELGRRPEPPASFGSSWGDPSGREEASGGLPPYESRPPQSGPSYGPAPESPASNPSQSGPQQASDSPSFGRPDDSPSFESPSFGPPGGSPSFEGPSFGRPDGRPHEASGPSGGSGRPYGGPSFGPPDGGGTRAYESPFFGAPQGGDTRSYDRPPFGAPLPPPPQQALGMGAGWAPPPPGAPGSPGSGVARRRGPGTGALIAMAAVIALVASLLGSVGTYLLTKPSSASNDPSYSLGPIPTGATERAPDSVAGVALRVLPSVVSIEAGNTSNTEGSSGSGFLIKNGYVVTNNHVVALAASGGEIRIMFNNRKTTTGRIVGRDPGSDLAVVKPEETFGTPEITLGNSDQVVVGDPVIAVGSPLGLTGTVTTGIVSSLNRPVIAGDETGTTGEEPAYISAIQTDAAINPGNSGGPLVNGRGEVVGVNSAIATLSRTINSQSGSIGLGFAIPVNQTRRVAEELISTGRAKRPKIGIVLDQDYRGEGVRIASEPAGGQQPVDANGPAAKAGLKAGDVILEMDGLPLQDGNELIALIRSKAPGAKITIKYQRAGQERTASLTVTADPDPIPTPS